MAGNKSKLLSRVGEMYMLEGNKSTGAQAAKARSYLYFLHPRLELIPGTVKRYPLGALSSN